MMPISPQCPVCHQADALVSLGTRRDRAPWRFWITWTTYLYLCAACHALIEVSEQEMASPRPAARAFTAPGAYGSPAGAAG